jgi:hypothetical protein
MLPMYNDVFVETCKANLIIKDTNKIYNDIEVIFIYKTSKYRDFIKEPIFLETYLDLFKEACLNFDNKRCVLYMSGD